VRATALLLQIVELLVRQGADVTAVNRDGQTAVDVASSTVVRHLLLAAVDQGGPLHNLSQAAWQGNVVVLQRILVRHNSITIRVCIIISL